MTAVLSNSQDIIINGIPLNYRDSDGCFWVLSEMDGWWTLPASEVPEDQRPYTEEGNYYTVGRFTSRVVEITGYVLPPGISKSVDEDLIDKARNKLIRAVTLARSTGLLVVKEPTISKQLEVQLLGRPIFTQTANNVLKFNIQFVASNPFKYSEEITQNLAYVQTIQDYGYTYDRTYNRVYGDNPYFYLNVIYVDNKGDINTYGTLRITGPIQNPKVYHKESDKFFKLNLTLTANDYVDIDLRKKTVIQNGTQSKLASLDFSSSWFEYTPGINSLLFSGETVVAVQEGWPAATNLVTNPTIQSTVGSSSAVIHTNSMLDPDFEQATGSFIQIRKNYAANPTFSGAPGGTFTDYAENATTNVRVSNEWSTNITNNETSLLLTPKTTNNDTYVDVTPTNLVFNVGQTYTASATIFIKDTINSTLHDNALSIVFRYTLDGDTVDEKSTAAVNTFGQTRLSKSFTVPAGASNVKILLYNGAGQYDVLLEDNTNYTILEPVWWDDLLISDSLVETDFFHNNTVPINSLVQYSLASGVSIEEKRTTSKWTADSGTYLYIEKDFDEPYRHYMAVTYENGALITVGSTSIANLSGLIDTVTLSAEFKPLVDTNITPVLYQIDGNGDNVYTYGQMKTVSAGQNLRISSVFNKPIGTYYLGFTLERTVPSFGERTKTKVTDVSLIDGTYTGAYFDGTTQIVDMTTAWTGAIQYSTSQASANTVPGYTASTEANIYISTSWSKFGKNSLAVQKKDSIGVVSTTYATISSPTWSSLPNGSYTVYAHILAEDGFYTNDPSSRTITVVDDTSGSIYRSQQAVPGVPSKLSVTFTKTGSSGEIRLVSNAKNSEIVRWDGILIVSGNYSGRYFDGTMESASWSGTAHNSTSIQTYRSSIPAATLVSKHRSAWIG